MLIFHWTCCNNDKNNHKKCDPHRRPARPTATGPQPEAMMLQYFQDVMLFLFGCTKQGPNEPCWGPSGAHWPKWGHWGPKGHPLGPPLGPQWAPLAPQCRPPRPPLEGPDVGAAYGNSLRELTEVRRFLTGISPSSCLRELLTGAYGTAAFPYGNLHPQNIKNRHP